HPTGPQPSGLLWTPWTPAKGDSTKRDFALVRARDELDRREHAAFDHPAHVGELLWRGRAHHHRQADRLARLFHPPLHRLEGGVATIALLHDGEAGRT